MESIQGPVQMGVRAPPEMFSAVQNILDAHLEDDVGVCADPRASCRDAAQYGVKHVPRPAFVNRIDPDEDTVKSQKLIADFARNIVGIDHGQRVDAERKQFFEYPAIAVVIRRRGAPRFLIATPDYRGPITLRGLQCRRRAKCWARSVSRI